jgi:hypothetical protein
LIHIRERNPMKRLLMMFFCLALCLAMGGVAFPDNLVVNGKFEAISYAGDGTQIIIPSLDGWGVYPADQGSNYGFWDVKGYLGPTNYGIYFAGPGPDFDAIGQSIPTVAGNSYTFTFCLARLNSSSIYPDHLSKFDALWNGTPVLSIESADTFDWTYFTYTVLATGASSTIAFQGTALDSGGGYEFTDVRLSSVPLPGTLTLLGSGLLSLLGWRRLRQS